MFHDRGHPRTILVVDDNDLDVERIERGMRRLGIEARLLRAADGIEGLAALRGDSAPAVDQPVVVLLDLNMPRMSGLDFLAELRRDPALAATPVLVLSTSTRPADIRRALQLNVSGYVVKPASSAEMDQVLRSMAAFWSICEWDDADVESTDRELPVP